MVEIKWIFEICWKTYAWKKTGKKYNVYGFGWLSRYTLYILNIYKIVKEADVSFLREMWREKEKKIKVMRTREERTYLEKSLFNLVCFGRQRERKRKWIPYFLSLNDKMEKKKVERKILRRRMHAINIYFFLCTSSLKKI